MPYDLRWRFAVHEAGHAVVHHALDLGPVHGLNIDTGAGGYNLLGFHPSGSNTAEWYGNLLAVLLAGRAAEVLVLKRASGGAGGSDDSDLARATRIALDMERTLGLGEEYPLLYRADRNPADVLDGNPQLAARVHDRLQAALDAAMIILQERRRVFKTLTSELFNAQVLDGNQILLILGASD